MLANLSQWVVTLPMVMACMIWQATFGSGVQIGTMRIITVIPPQNTLLTCAGSLRIVYGGITVIILIVPI
jgi:hypothetical protein